MCAPPVPISGIISAISVFLCRIRNWLAGPRMTFADLAAAAHCPVADYLGDVPWAENDPRRRGIRRSSRGPVPQHPGRPCARHGSRSGIRRPGFLIAASPDLRGRRRRPHRRPMDRGRASRRRRIARPRSRRILRADDAPSMAASLGEWLERGSCWRHGSDGGDRRSARPSARASGRRAIDRHARHELWPVTTIRSRIFHIPDAGNISVYARNRDYHEVIKGRLKLLASKLVARQAAT